MQPIPMRTKATARDLLMLYEACIDELQSKDSLVRKNVFAKAAASKAEILQKERNGKTIVDDPTLLMSLKDALRVEYLRVASAMKFKDDSSQETLVYAMVDDSAAKYLESLRKDIINSGLLPKIGAAHESFAFAERQLVVAAVEGEDIAQKRSKREKEKQTIMKQMFDDLKKEMAVRSIDEQAALLKMIGADAQKLVNKLKAREKSEGKDMDFYVMDEMPIEELKPIFRMQVVQQFLHQHENDVLLQTIVNKQHKVKLQRPKMSASFTMD
eukprot:g6024.t1